MASAACVGCEWHAVVAAGGVAAAAAASGSSGSGVDCGVAVVVAFAVAAAVGIGVPPELDCHCVLETVAFAVGIQDWKRKTSATLAKDVAVAAVVVVGYCLLSGLACPGALASVASADPGGVASDSRECFHRACQVVGGHRASAGGSVVAAAEHSGDPWRSDGGHFPCGDGAAVVVVPAVGCVEAAGEDALQ